LQKRYPKAAVKRGRRFVDNGKVVTTAGISAGIDGSLHVVARLLGRMVADEVATYMEYAWSPEASLAQGYSYLNPSTDERGRQMQTGDIHYTGKDYVEAEKAYRALLAENAKDVDAWRSLALCLRAQEKHQPAAEAFTRQAEVSKDEMVGYTWVMAAVEYAKAGRKEEAVGSLQKAFAAPPGHFNPDMIQTEPALASVASDPRVRQLLAKK
jgi:tetratricopeptide (TPR) repeat protein